jgi:hypothetical protein
VPRLDEEITRSYRNSRTAQRLDKEPLVTFIFKYRPIGTFVYCILSSRADFRVLEMLQANGIAPLNNPPKKRRAPQQNVVRVKNEHGDVIDIDEEEKAQRIKALEVSGLFLLTD